MATAAPWARGAGRPWRRSGHTVCVDLRQLAALVAIVDHGSFSGAAAALHTVQSNVSGHIKRLERELGAELVDRQTGSLTEEGRAVEARARAVQAEMDAIAADLAALHQHVQGSVRLDMILPPLAGLSPCCWTGWRPPTRAFAWSPPKGRPRPWGHCWPAAASTAPWSTSRSTTRN